MSEQPGMSERGFTLVEMLVVIGIIGALIALLLPSLSRAQAQAQQIKCASNLSQIGKDMLIYADSNNGYLFPPNKGWPTQQKNPDGTTTVVYPPTIDGANPPPQYDVWPFYVFGNKWNPDVMQCPTDFNLNESQHSYLANAHILPQSMVPRGTTQPTGFKDLTFGRPLPPGRSSSDIVVVGEKVSSVYDYYMDPGDFDTKVEQYRHGPQIGSNYLMMDFHVETLQPSAALGGLDPWDPNGPPGG